MLVKTLLVAVSVSLLEASELTIKEHPAFTINTFCYREKCKPILDYDFFKIPHEKDEYTIGNIQKIQETNGIAKFSFTNGIGESFRSVVIKSEEKEALAKYRRDLIERKMNWLARQTVFYGLIIDPDTLTSNPAYAHGKYHNYSLKRLTSRGSFLNEWKDKLKKISRGKLIFRFPVNEDAQKLSRPDHFLLYDEAKYSLVQVVGQPYFEQASYETIHLKHYSMYSMVPAAAFNQRLNDIFASVVSTKKALRPQLMKLKNTRDWATQFLPANGGDGYLKVTRNELENGLMDKLISALRKTRKFTYWSDIQLSHAIDASSSEKYLVDKSKFDIDFGLMFTTALDFIGDDCEEWIIKNKDKISLFIRLQYDAIMLNAITKVRNVEVVHLYPLVIMHGLLASINLEALMASVKQWTAYGPSITIIFHHLHQVTEIPLSKPYKNAYKTPDLALKVIRQLAESDGDTINVSTL